MSTAIHIDDIDNLKLGPLARGVDLTRIDTAEKYDLGSIAIGRGTNRGKMYRYVKFLDAITYAAGQVVTVGAATDWHVTNDRAGGSAVAGHGVVGVALAVHTQNSFGWIQVAGLVQVAGTYAAGDYVIPHATSDGEAVVSGYTAAKANFNIFAYALSSSLVRLQGLV